MTVATEVWGIEKRMPEQYLWVLDLEIGLFTDRDLAAEEVSRRNQAERRRLETQHEQQYRERLAVWHRATAASQAVVSKPDWLPSPTKPLQTRYVHSDTYRVSRSIQVHSRV